MTNLVEGTYVISEIEAPDGFQLDETPKTVVAVSGRLVEVEFRNKPLSGIEIVKVNHVNNQPLSGAKFIVERDNGEKIGEYKTDSAGKILVTGLSEGTYVVSETVAPDGFQLDETPKNVIVVSGKLTTIEFRNKPLSGIEIVKVDNENSQPLANAKFSVTRTDGSKIGTYKTDVSGKALVTDLFEGDYIVAEIEAPDGYQLDETPKTVTVKSGKMTEVEFRNKPLSGIEIIKVDNENSQPLANAKFKVTRNTGEVVGTYTTNVAGKILVTGLEEATYVVSEIEAPNGYQLDETPKNVIVKSGKLSVIEFRNKPYSGIEIVKLDSVTHKALSGATFVVERDNGEFIGEYVTDNTGKIIVSGLNEDTYIVSEKYAPDGYEIDSTPKTVVVKSGKLTTVEFLNKPYSGIEILKLSSLDNSPLTGATFLVERVNGERVAEIETDSTGKAIISDLEEGTYIVSEKIAPEGFILDENPRTVEVVSGKVTVLEFFNKPLQGLTIMKISSVDRSPIQGTEFQLVELDGTFVGNYKTDKNGMINIPMLPPDIYVLTEVKAADGFITNSEPRIIKIEWGEAKIIEIENTPMSSMMILKTDSQTKKPLAGVKFLIERWDGYRIGVMTTDANGRIYLNNLPADDYVVHEVEALEGYELDDTAYEISVRPGKQEVIEIQNTPMAGLRILKIDSISKKPIYNVEFMVFDSNNKQVGTFYTDNNGIIDFAGILPSGRYTIRETRLAAGYYADDIPKTIEFVSGKITEIVWENVPNMGQIQIYKTSADDNEMTGLAAGTPLANAVFEVYEYKTGNMVDRFVSGDNGMAVSSPLPLGRYIVKEVKAPQYYQLSDKQLDITIEFASQIIKQEFKNYSINLGVSIKKSGNYECMPGDTIAYTVKNIRNDSTVALNSFYWRDMIPTDAARLSKIVTGTYNKSVKYKIMVKTNKGNEMVIADNLKTNKNNVIDCSNASLGLTNDEYVTSFYVIFGNVPTGFAQVEKAQVYLKVHKNLPNNYEFANKVDVGGKYGGEWVIGNSTWVTKVYSKPQPLPNTGY